MRVVISSRVIYPFHSYGGVEKYFFYLGKYLVKQGVDVEIITSSIGGKKSEVYEGIKYTFIAPPSGSKGSLIPLTLLHLFSMNLARYLRRTEFDILHSYDMTPYYYSRFKHRVPVVFTPFLLYEVCAPTQLKGVNRILVMGLGRYFFRRSLIKYLLTNADAVVSEGDFQTEDIMELFGLDRKKFYNLPPGVDISQIKEGLKSQRISRTDLGIGDDLVLISVNRLEQVKGINYLIDAFNLIKERLEKSRLILIGTGSEEGRIIDQMKRYGLMDNIIHLKNVSEEALYNYYALSDIYLSPVLHTDFVMGIEEAMASGLPIVSTGQPWLVKPGVNGFIVPPRDPQRIADAVLEIHGKNLTKKMGAKSAEIVKDYDWNVIARKAISMYEEVIHRREKAEVQGK